MDGDLKEGLKQFENDFEKNIRHKLLAPYQFH
jgi:hypothetical protein